MAAWTRPSVEGPNKRDARALASVSIRPSERAYGTLLSAAVLSGNTLPAAANSGAAAPSATHGAATRPPTLSAAPRLPAGCRRLRSAAAVGPAGATQGRSGYGCWTQLAGFSTSGSSSTNSSSASSSNGAGPSANGSGGGGGAGGAALSPGLESRLRQLYGRYGLLEAMLAGTSSSEADPGEAGQGGGGGGAPLGQAALREAGREYSRLRPLATKYERLLRVRQELADLASLLRDPDPGVRGLAEEEAEALREESASLTRRLLLALLPRDPRDGRPVLLELRAGAGGSEAALFCGELLAMYGKLAESRGWSWQVVDITSDELGGVRHAYVAVADPAGGGGGGGGESYDSGDDDGGEAYGGGVYGTLASESGVHRVQRVPVTDAQGRMHTSTAVVIVLAQAEELDVRIRPEDLRVETMRASGAGGQHVNVTDSAVRITHLPTGISVSCQNERSQLQNRLTAIKVLRSRLYDMEAQKRARDIDEQRSALGGAGDRGERVRTYNYAQGRVTDHRIHLTVHNLESVLSGGEGLERLLGALRGAREEEALAALAEREAATK